LSFYIQGDGFWSGLRGTGHKKNQKFPSDGIQGGFSTQGRRYVHGSLLFQVNYSSSEICRNFFTAIDPVAISLTKIQLP